MGKDTKKDGEKLIPIDITWFDPDWIPPGALVAVIGRRFSGKSWAIRSILHTFYLRGIPYGAIFSGTEHCSPFFRQYFPDAFIYTEEDFTDEKIGEMLKEQARRCAEALKKKRDCSCLHCRKNPYKFEQEKGHSIHNSMVLVTDDMMSQERLLKKSANFKKIFTEGRHYNIIYMLCLQYSLGLPPALRSNVDYVFLYQTEEATEVKKLYENFAGIFPDLQTFREVLDKCTEKHGCLVIDRRSRSRNLAERVFYFKAHDPGPFKFGDKYFWDLHYKATSGTIVRNPSTSKQDMEEYYREKSRKILESYGKPGDRYSVVIRGDPHSSRDNALSSSKSARAHTSHIHSTYHKPVMRTHSSTFPSGFHRK
jgi:hypothetical protein